jgi:long-chain acyl-CoA synthetase
MNPNASLVNLLSERARTDGGLPALWSRHGRARFRAVTWSGAQVLARRAAGALRAAGLRRGDVVALEGGPHLDLWALALGAMASGIVPALVFGDWPEETLKAAIARCGARALATANGALAARAAGWGKAVLERVIALDAVAGGDGRVTAFEALLGSAALEDAADPEPSAIGLIAFTAGTTGEPKPVALRHQGLAFTSLQAARLAGLTSRDVLLALEPLAHLPEILVCLGLPLASGAQLFLGDGAPPQSLVRDVRPTCLFARHPFWERMAHVAEARAGSEMRGGERVFSWARREAARKRASELDLARSPAGLSRYRLARLLVLDPLKRELGLDRARHLACSGAALAPSLRDALGSLDLPLLEVYGQVEAGGPIALNAVGSQRPGTVGRSLPGTELRIADDGEVMVRGPHVGAGYLGDPAASRYLYEDEGWLKTGDVGELDEEGFLRILGRKSDLFFTASGQRIFPSSLEERLRGVLPIAHALVFGDGRPASMALLSLDAERARTFATERGLPSDGQQLAGHPTFLSYLQRAVEDALARPPAMPGIGRFAVVPEGFSTMGGTLTPIGTVRRREALERHGRLLDEPRADPGRRRGARDRH